MLSEHQDELFEILKYMGLPALVSAALILFVIEWLGGAKQSAAGAALAIIVGAVVGLIGRDLGSVLKEGLPRDQSLDTILIENLRKIVPDILWYNSGTWDRLPWAVLGALSVGRVAGRSDGGWFLRGAAAIGIAWWLVPEALREQHFWLVPAYAGTIWLLWIILDDQGSQPGGSSVSLCASLVMLTAAPVILLAGSMKLMDSAFVLGFAMAGIWLIAFWRTVDVSGATPAIAVALPSLLLICQQTVSSELPWYVYASPAFAPLVLIPAMLVQDGPRWALHLMRLLLILLPLAFAMVILMRETGESFF